MLLSGGILPTSLAQDLTIDTPRNISTTHNNGDGALLTLRAKNIQVRADWSAEPDSFSVDNGKLRLIGHINEPTNFAVTVMVKDKFKDLNDAYDDLTIQATINLSLQPGQRIFVMGGVCRNESVNVAVPDVWSSSDGKNWELVAGNAGWDGTDYPNVVAYGYNMYILSTDSNLSANNGDLSTMWTSSYGTTWEKIINLTLFSLRFAPKSVTHNDKIYLTGGFGISYLSDVWSWDDNNGNDWEEVTNSAPWAKVFHQAVSNNNLLYVLGGAVNGGNSNDVWSSANGAQWTLRTGATGAGWSKRRNFAAVVHQNTMYVMGGDATGDGYANDVWSSTDGGTWTLQNNAPWDGRREYDAVSYQGRIYVLGGIKGNDTNAANYLDDVWSSADGQNWSLETDNPGWCARRSLQAIVFPSE